MVFIVDYSKEEGNVYINANDGASGAKYNVSEDNAIKDIASALETYMKTYYSDKIGKQNMEFKGYTAEPVYNENADGTKGDEAYQQYTMKFEEANK